MFEDLNYDELKRRANSSLPEGLVARPMFQLKRFGGPLTSRRAAPGGPSPMPWTS